jgi:hypothetical protein
VADSVNRIVSPSLSLDRAVAIDRERDRARDKERDENKRGAEAESAERESAAPQADRPDEKNESTDPKKGKSLDIKI